MLNASSEKIFLNEKKGKILSILLMLAFHIKPYCYHSCVKNIECQYNSIIIINFH